VLEHIIDDRKAIEELFRVMKPEGVALILLPIFHDLERTFEDPTITNRKTRKKVFGQEDHVRKCGPDYWDRITEAGFQLHQKNYTFEGSREEKRCYSLLDGMREKDYQDYLNLFTKPK
jgi:ubiquinone/menaquinone biosynthesis C-methylase UbiE